MTVACILCLILGGWLGYVLAALEEGRKGLTMNKWYKLETSEDLNPCKCGCTRRAYFRKGETVYIKCVMCLLTATGKGEEEAEENWQKITEGVKVRYAKVGEGKAGSEVKKSGGRAKTRVQRKPLSRGDSSGA